MRIARVNIILKNKPYCATSGVTHHKEMVSTLVLILNSGFKIADKVL
jgi:hypothetical protein